MKRLRTVIILAAVLVLVVCGIWRSNDSTSDPVHAGKRASAWLFELGCGDPVREQQATNAFSELGIKALPFLKATLNRRDSCFRRLLLKLQDKFPNLGNRWHSSSAPWRAGGLMAAHALGTNALPILPEVLEAITDWCIGGDEYTQVTFLASFGRAGLAPIAAELTRNGSMHAERALLQSLNLIRANNELSTTDQMLIINTLTNVLHDNWDEFVDREAAQTLGHFGARSEPAIPVLLDCLTNREPKSSVAAAWALGQINRQPEIVVPALIQATDSRRFWMVRTAAIQALGEFGTNTTLLRPLLLRLSADGYEAVRVTALELLLKVAPAEKSKPDTTYD